MLKRGLVGRCPNCANRSLFAPKSLRVRECCPICELPFNPGGGFWLGPLVINYAISAFGFVIPILLLGLQGVLPLGVAVVLAVSLGCLGLPLLLYRRSWAWWLMIYYSLLPHELPANDPEAILHLD